MAILLIIQRMLLNNTVFEQNLIFKRMSPFKTPPLLVFVQKSNKHPSIYLKQYGISHSLI